MTDLDVLDPGREFSVGAETLRIVPFTFGQIPRVTKLLQPIAKALAGASIVGVKPDEQLWVAADWASRLVDIIADTGEDALTLLGFAIKKDRAWFDSLGADVGYELAKAVVEVNADFFTRRMMPLFNAAELPAGSTPSPSSSPGGTAAPTSTVTP